MNANMYRHEIDECLERAYAELDVCKTCRSYEYEEYAKHVRRRIESLKRLRKTAEKACFAPKIQQEEYERKTLEEILMEFRPY